MNRGSDVVAGMVRDLADLMPALGAGECHVPDAEIFDGKVQ